MLKTLQNQRRKRITVHNLTPLKSDDRNVAQVGFVYSTHYQAEHVVDHCHRTSTLQHGLLCTYALLHSHNAIQTVLKPMRKQKIR